MSPRKYLLAALVAGASLPALAALDRYTVDPEHTYPSLEFPHMGLSIWRGRFNKTSGKVTLDREARTGTVEIKTEISSIDFGHPKMKEFALTEEWLNAAAYPTMTYSGTVNFDGSQPASIDGTLFLRGIYRPLKLKINQFKCIPHPIFKKELCGADAEGDLDRAEYGMTLYTGDGMGKLHLRIQVEGLKDN